MTPPGAQLLNSSTESKSLVAIAPRTALPSLLFMMLHQSPTITFRQCAKKYIEAHQSGWSNPKHAAQWQATLATYAYPVIGNLPVKKIGANGDGTDLVMKILEPIWPIKTETASRVRGRVEKIFSIGRGRAATAMAKIPLGGRVISTNCYHHVAGSRRSSTTQRCLIKTFPPLWRSCASNRARQHARWNSPILTAARTGEVVGARQSEIDRAARIWTVPAERMKARREHRVPLCDAALAIIDPAPPGEFLFPGAKPDKPMSNMTMTALLDRMGIRGHVTTHGFRSTFRDWASETTHYPNEMLEMAIAHRIDSKIEAAYRRGDLLKKRHKLMRDWQRFCDLSSKATLRR